MDRLFPSFPHNSTQVVDFPRMSVVSIFLKDEKQLNLVRGIPSGAWNQDGEAMRNRQGRRPRSVQRVQRGR